MSKQRPIKKRNSATTKKSAQLKNKLPNKPARLSAATRSLLSRPEGLEVDFKRDAEAVKQDDLVAFANSGGGTILA